jgi:hypothetical protein
LASKVSLKRKGKGLEVLFFSLFPQDGEALLEAEEEAPLSFPLFLFLSSPPDEKGVPSRLARRDARI